MHLHLIAYQDHTKELQWNLLKGPSKNGVDVKLLTQHVLGPVTKYKAVARVEQGPLGLGLKLRV